MTHARLPSQNVEYEVTLAQEIVQLSDNFSEFNKMNAFLCEAFTRVMSTDDPVREDVHEGAMYCSELLQARSQELKVAIEQLRERCVSEDF